jgi:pimeloyl-ACP methyl ester carboxylesterase
MTTMKRRTLRAGMASLLAASVLAGCALVPVLEEGQSLWPPAPGEPSDPGTSVIDADLGPELLGFYQQTLEFRACYSGLECFTVLAPLDWDNPTKGTIELEGVRTRAAGTRVGSLLVNPGGPGGSAIDQVAKYGRMSFGRELHESFDLVGVDPRGVGQSTPITCFASTEDKDEYLLEIVTLPQGSDEWFAFAAEEMREYAEQCERLSGPVIGYVDTMSAARDMDLVRALLGEPQLYYLGFSYGTYLGSMYAELYPHRVGRLVLDGAVNPDEDAFEGSLAQAKGFDSALLAYLQQCLSRRDCPLSGTPERAAQQLVDYLLTLDDRPIRNVDGRMMGTSAAVIAVITPLYAEDTWMYLDMVIDGLLDRDPMMAFVMFDAYASRVNGEYTGNAMEAIGAINCLDTDVSDVTIEQLRAEAELLQREAPYFGQFLSYGGYSCTQWPWKHRGYPDLRAEGAAPILVIGTTNDPATPYASAVHLAEKLDSGILITFEGEGHTAYGQQNACIVAVVHDYLIRGAVPESDPRCS